MQHLFHIGKARDYLCGAQHRIQGAPNTPLSAHLLCDIAKSAHNANFSVRTVEQWHDIHFERALCTVAALAYKALATNIFALQCTCEREIIFRDGLPIQSI